MKKYHLQAKYILVFVLAVICAGLWMKQYDSLWRSIFPKEPRKCANWSERYDMEKQDQMAELAKMGCLVTLQRLEQKYTTDTVTKEQAKLLMASITGDLKTVKKLIRNGVDVNRIDSDPFTSACYQGHTEIVKEFIKAGVNVNADDGSPLVAAARGGHSEIVDILLQSGAKLNQKYNALAGAASTGNISIMKTLLAVGADVQADNNIALKAAVFGRQLEAVKELIKAGANVNTKAPQGVKRNIVWAWARGANYTEIVKVLEDAGVRVDNAQKRLALEIASSFGNLEVVKQLIAEGVDVNGDKDIPIPLVRASREGHLKVVEELLRAKADVNKKSDKYDWNVTALMAASAWEPHTDIVQLLLDNGADVNLQGNEQYTALNYVAHGNGSLEIVQKLLKAGANPNIKTQYGDNALLLAIDAKNLHLITPLLDADADVNVESNNGNRPLTVAAAGGYVKVVKQLLARGADINAQNATKKDTALILAADRGQIDVVKILIQAGADVHLKNKTGKDAEAYARQRGHRKIENLLKQAAKA